MEARRERVAAAYTELGSMRRVAKALGMSTRTVLEDVNELGVERLPSGQRPKRCKLDREARQELVAARYEQGDSAQAIADALGVAKGTVLNDLETKGVESRRVGRPAKYPPAKPRECAYCGASFTPPKPSDWEQRFCSRSCWGRHRFHVLFAIPDHFAPLTEVVTGRSRQIWLGRREGKKYGVLGGRPRVYTDEQERQVLELRQLHPDWGRATLADASGLSEKTVRGILKTARP